MVRYEVFLILGAVILVAFGIRLFVGMLDGERIRSYISEQGGDLLEKHWSRLVWREERAHLSSA